MRILHLRSNGNEFGDLPSPRYLNTKAAIHTSLTCLGEDILGKRVVFKRVMSERVMADQAVSH